MGHYLKSKPGSIEEAVSSVQSRPFIEDKEAYQKFFNAALKKFKIKSPGELKSDEEKKKFFNYIDKNYKSDAEKKESKESKTLTGKKMSEIETNKLQTKESLVPSMRKALLKIWEDEVKLDEKIEYVEYKFKNRSDAMKAQKHFMKQNQGPDYEFMDDDINNGTLGVDAGKDDMTKHHNEVMRKFRPKIVAKEGVEINEKKYKVNGKVEYKGVRYMDDFQVVVDASSPEDAESKAFNALDASRKAKKIGPGGGGSVDSIHSVTMDATGDKVDKVPSKLTF
tara:strand:- start:247 stop:1086 length:840 start_codon:yes stop_codon:yes gene_type:complete